MKIKITNNEKWKKDVWISGEIDEDNEIVDMLKSLSGNDFKLSIIQKEVKNNEN